jgi:hypothetical protein
VVVVVVVAALLHQALVVEVDLQMPKKKKHIHEQYHKEGDY